MTNWPEETKLSVYDGGGRPIPPDRAYRGMETSYAIAAAMVDSVIWDLPSWVADIVAWRSKEPPPIVLSQTDAWLREHGWRDVEDVYDAAGVTEQQRIILGLRLLGNTDREIGRWVGISPLMVRVQGFRAMAKLRTRCL